MPEEIANMNETGSLLANKVPKNIRKRYRNEFYLERLVDIDKQIYTMVIDFMHNKKLKRVWGMKELMGQYAIATFLLGTRRQELLRSNVTFRKTITPDEAIYYQANHVNCKHWEGNKLKARTGPDGKKLRLPVLQQYANPRRKMLRQTFIATNAYETALWEFLLQGSMTKTIDFTYLFKNRDLAAKVFQSDQELYEGYNPKAYALLESLTVRFQRAFRLQLTNGRKKTDVPTIHCLRHIRAYSLWIEKGFRAEIVSRLLGWDSSTEMLNYYAYIKEGMSDIEAIQFYESYRANPTWYKMNAEVRPPVIHEPDQ